MHRYCVGTYYYKNTDENELEAPEFALSQMWETLPTIGLESWAKAGN